MVAAADGPAIAADFGSGELPTTTWAKAYQDLFTEAGLGVDGFQRSGI
jgi:hypothetical protein